MGMGAQNSAPTFTSIMEVIRIEQNKVSDTNGVPDTVSEFIKDDIMIFVMILDALIKYLETVLKILCFYRFMMEIQKIKLQIPALDYVGIYFQYKGNAPEETKYPVFVSLNPPNAFKDPILTARMFSF